MTLTLNTAELFGEIFAGLRKRGKPIPTNDIWIAAQAIENDSSLLSSDPHFGFVEKLSWLHSRLGDTCSPLQLEGLIPSNVRRRRRSSSALGICSYSLVS